MEFVVKFQLVRDAETPKRRIRSAEDVVVLCKEMRKLDREHFRALYLNARNGLLGIEVLDHVVIGEGYWSMAENMEG